MSLQAGDHLGPYEILGFVGAGGMGEVYRARDPRLNRAVAIKVLHAAVVADPERLRRFTAEAQAIAALNHPNVLTISSINVWNRLNVATRQVAREWMKSPEVRSLVEKGAPAAV